METFSPQGDTDNALDPWYVTGLVELGGTFTFSRTDRNVVPYFAITLGGDEAGLLESLQSFFGGIGRVYTIPRREDSAEAVEGAPRARYFRITRVEDLDLVVSHFDEHPLRGSKAGAYGIWRELVVLKRTTYRKPDRARVDGLCVALSSLTGRGRRRG